MENDMLHPVSYHLRDFGQYHRLDLQAAAAGNLTLLGANAVGKTTLANAWFPVLIDGSIKTPSFNAARSSDTVAQSAKPQNTKRDKRTFNSMLLGWGAGAFKVRTGYTYMVLASSQRQVVLGIGAHRQSDGAKANTWWFVLESQYLDKLVCTDAAGNGLPYQDFLDHNSGFGAELVVFKHWEEYRNFVAVQLYGFDSGDELGKLANAYRLLASPILTGGSARFAPIPEALRDAQEPIDKEQIIRPLADSQRQLNQTIARQQRFTDGQKRLAKIQTELFWGNFDFLAQEKLPAHIKEITARDHAQNAAANAAAAVVKLNEQLHLLEQQSASEKKHLRELQQQLAAQAELESKRKLLDANISDLHQRQIVYDRQQVELQKYQEAVSSVQAEIARLTAAASQLQHAQINPIRAQIATQSADLHELARAITTIEEQAIWPALDEYLRTKRSQLQQYHNLDAAIARSSSDVRLVQGMQGALDESIDKHANGILAKSANTNLHKDNHTIHEAGAAKMNTAVVALQQEQHELLAQAPDLELLLANPQRLLQLEALVDQAQPLVKRLQANEQQRAVKEQELKGKQAQAQQVKTSMDQTFDLATNNQQIAALTAQRDALQIDNSLQKRLAQQEQTVDQLQATGNELVTKRGGAVATATSQKNLAAQAQTELSAIDAQLTASLAVLRKFAPADCALNDIDALLQFVQANRAKIKLHPFRDLGGKIRDAVDGRETAPSLADLFSELNAPELAAALHQQRTASAADLTIVPFDLAEAQRLLVESSTALAKAVTERTSTQSLALKTFMTAAVMSISEQYKLIPQYNAMLTAGTDPDGIRLHVKLQPLPGDTATAVAEAQNLQLEERPALAKVVRNAVHRLVEDPKLADDDEAFIERAGELLDTRRWSKFVITINRRHSDVEELVDDAFVQSGGSGAEKAQAMVLPLLLVPKMRLRQAKSDAPHLVMFDEFADKLDPETARAFARTIDRFGFNFIATMPSGAQAKILADGVANRAYEVLAPRRKDGKFHVNQVHEVLTWHAEAQDE